MRYLLPPRRYISCSLAVPGLLGLVAVSVFRDMGTEILETRERVSKKGSWGGQLFPAVVKNSRQFCLFFRVGLFHSQRGNERRKNVFTDQVSLSLL